MLFSRCFAVLKSVLVLVFLSYRNLDKQIKSKQSKEEERRKALLASRKESQKAATEKFQRSHNRTSKTKCINEAGTSNTSKIFSKDSKLDIDINWLSNYCS